MMTPLTISDDKWSFLVDGQPWTWRGTLTWPLWGLYLLDRPRALALMDDRKRVGANTVCFASMLYWPHNGLEFGPATPGYYGDTVRSFAADLLARELRACCVVLCDTRFLMQVIGAMRAHWQWWYTAVGDQPNWSFVLANQPGHQTQAIRIEDIPQFEAPPSIAGFPAALACPYNPHEDDGTILPTWGSFSAFCSKRQEPHWWCEIGFSHAHITQLGANGQPPQLRATVNFEPPPANRPNHDEWDDPGKWRQFARGHGMKGIVGGNFYSNEDTLGLLYGDSRNAAIEFLGNLPSS